MYDLTENPIVISIDQPSVIAFRTFETEAIRLGGGAGPAPNGGAPALCFSVRADCKAGGKMHQTLDADSDVPACPIIARLFLDAFGGG